MRKNSLASNYAAVVAGAVALLLVSWLVTITAVPREARAQFGSQALFATSVAGTNTITMNVPNMFSLVRGVPFSFIPANTNTGPSTINVNSLGNTTVKRPSSIGLIGLSGGELQVGVYTTVVYDGTNINLVYPVDPAPIASIKELRIPCASCTNSIMPPGYLIEDGSCVSQTTYAGLFAVIGGNYGSCSAGLFALPDSRGSFTASPDNQGSNGAAGRITSGGSGCAANGVGQRCGAQSATLTLAQIPTGLVGNNSNNVGVSVNSGARAVWSDISGGSVATGGASQQVGNISVLTSTGTIGSGGISVQITNTSGQAHPILNPILTAVRVIKY